MQHAQPLDRPFPWRSAALAAAALALAELAALLALAGIRVFHVHGATSTPAAASSPASHHPAPKPAVHPLRPRSRVSVLVLNGNGISGAASAKATQLLSGGYRHAIASDAPQAYARSLVLFRRGWEREAQRLARTEGIRTVTPLDGRLPRSDAGYQLVLILGAR